MRNSMIIHAAVRPVQVRYLRSAFPMLDCVCDPRINRGADAPITVYVCAVATWRGC